MVTCDAVVLTVQDGRLAVLLVERGRDPFAGQWAFPGGYLDMDEPLEACAARELAEETGLRGIELAQLAAFGEPGRDPRGRTITVAFWALIDSRQVQLAPSDDAARADWHAIDALPPMAFDHGHVLQYAVEKVRNLVPWRGVGQQYLPPAFSVAALRALHEAILGTPLDAEAFAAQAARAPYLEPTGAGTYRFVPAFTEAF